MRKEWMAAIVFSSGAVLAPAACAQALVDFSPRYDAGQSTSYRHELHVDQSRTIPLVADQRRLVATIERDITLEILEVFPSGEARVRLVIDRVLMSVTPPEGEPFYFESDDAAGAEPNSARARALESYVDGEVDLRMAPNGELISIDGIRGYGARAGTGRVAREIDAFFNDKWLRSVTERIWCVSKEAPVREVGQEWSQSAYELVGGVAGNDAAVTYTLIAQEGDRAIVTGAGEIVADADGQVQFEGAPATKLEDLVKTRLEWDVNLGQLERYETDQAVGVQFPTQMGTDAQSVVASSIRLWRLTPEAESAPEGD